MNYNNFLNYNYIFYTYSYNKILNYINNELFLFLDNILLFFNGNNFILHIFLILSLLAIFSGFLVIFSKNPIHSIFFLILVFISVSGLLFLLNLEFLPIVFLVVYVGAISVLFLFVIMMLNIKIIEINENNFNYLPIGSLICFFLFIELILFYLLKTNYFLPIFFLPEIKYYTNNLDLITFIDYLNFNNFSSIYEVNIESSNNYKDLLNTIIINSLNIDINLENVDKNSYHFILESFNPKYYFNKNIILNWNIGYSVFLWDEDNLYEKNIKTELLALNFNRELGIYSSLKKKLFYDFILFKLNNEENKVYFVLYSFLLDYYLNKIGEDLGYIQKDVPKCVYVDFLDVYLQYLSYLNDSNELKRNLSNFYLFTALEFFIKHNYIYSNGNKPAYFMELYNDFNYLKQKSILYDNNIIINDFIMFYNKNNNLNDIKILSEILYLYNFFPFILASLILLVSMVGAIILTVSDAKYYNIIKRQNISNQVYRKVKIKIYKNNIL